MKPLKEALHATADLWCRCNSTECCGVYFHSSSAYIIYNFLSKTNICAQLWR